MSQTMTQVPVAVVLDANGQATVSFTDAGAVCGEINSVLATAAPVASKIYVGGVFQDYCLQGSWHTTGAYTSLLGATVQVVFDGGVKAAGVAGTVTFGVSPQ